MSYLDEYYKALEEERKKREQAAERVKAEAEKRNASLGGDGIASDNRKWFQKGAFEDGYQFGDVLKTTTGTIKDLRENLLSGVLGIGEAAVDAGAYLAGGVGKLLGADQFADKTKDFISKELVDEEQVAKAIVRGTTSPFLDPTRKYDTDDISILGERSDALVQSGGQLLGTMGLQAVGVPWFVTSGVTSFGSEAENAFNQGAGYGEAGVSAAITAGAEILTEKISGGIKFGGKTLDDALTKKLAREVSGKFLRNALKFGLDFAGEGLEEVMSENLSRFGQWLTYQDEESLVQMLWSEEAMDAKIEAFLSGGLLGGGSSAVNAVKSAAGGVDAVSGLTRNEQKVMDKVYKDAIEGKNLSAKEKARIYDEILEQMEKGYIDTETIESVLGDRSAYDSLVKESEEFDKLYNTPGGQLSKAQQDRLAQLEEKNRKSPYKALLEAEKGKFSQGVQDMVKGSRLAESYAERGRRGEKFQADVSRYDAKQRATVQAAIDSGVLNNTNRSHELVDFVAKLAADKGLTFDFANNEKLKETGFALEGVTVNGFVNEKGVTVNVQSAKALNAVVGHEITHVLEGTQLYDALAQSITEYAKAKGEYQSRYDSLAKLYAGVENANVEAEVVADLVGDYLFTDKAFVQKLSTENRNVFQKIFDEIKYLCKVVTAGSKEAKQLLEVKKAFEEAYRAETKNTVVEDGAKYSLNIKHTDGTVEELADARNLTDEQAIRYLDQAKSGALRGETYIPVRKDTPQVLIDTLAQAGEQVENCSLVMQVRKAQQAMSAPKNNKQSGKKGNNVRNHGLTPAQIVEIVNKLDDPSTVIYQTNRHDKNGNPLPNNVAVFVEYSKNGNDDVAVIEFDSTFDPGAIGTEFGDTQYHTVVTVFEPDAERNGIPFDYAEELLSNPDNTELKIEKRQSTESATREKHPNTSNELPSNNSIRNPGEDVNNKFSLSSAENVKAAEQHFGTTYKISEAGYLLTDGRLLDFSGKHEGGPGGYRTVDHRDITDALGDDYGDNSYSGGMIRFMGEGNIRLSPESGGINLSVKPNKAQLSTLDRYISNFRGEVILDIDDGNGNTVISVEYPKRTYSKRIINDINAYFENGTIPEPPSSIGQFLSLSEQKKQEQNGADDPFPLPWQVRGQDVALEDFAPIGENVVTKQNAAPEGELAPMREDVAAKNAKPQTEQEDSKVAKILFDQQQTPKQKSAWKWVREHIFSHGAVFEDLGLKTGNRELQAKFDNIRRAESRAQNFIGKGKGNAKALVDVRKAVEKAGKTEAFNYYLYHLHNADRMTLEWRFGGMSNKSVFGDSVDAETSRKAAVNLETLNPEFKQWAQDVYAINHHLRQMMVDEGIISQETADLWQEMYPHYVPISRAGAKGLNINVPLDTKRTGVNAPIKKATGGNSDFYNVFDTMGSRIEQTYKAIARNRFGVELMNTLGTTFESEQADIDTVLENMDTHEELLQEGKNGESPTFTVFRNGEKVKFAITEDMYDAMKPGQFTYTNKTMRKINDVRRDILTTYSPTFALTNPIKDAQDILLNSQHPVRTYAAIPEAIKSVIKKDLWYQERMEHGGNQDTYFDGRTKTFKKEAGWFKKVMGFVPGKIQAANEIIEQVPRMAEYIASRKMGRSIDVSMLDAARVTTNFGAAGDFTNMLNRNGFTFLGASVEGFNQQVRNVREAKAEGVKGWAKLAGKYLAAGLPVLLLNHALWDDDEEYEELSDYVKQNYYVVAKTEDGEFVRIPKGRAVAVIQDAFRQMENLITGDDKVDLEAFGQLILNNLAPNNPMDNNLLAPLAQAYSNKTWYGDELVPTRLQDVPAAEQYDETTDSLSRWLGEVTDTSPYKWNYLLDQYTGGIGDIVLPYLTPEADGGGLGAAFRDKFTTDPVLKNQNVSDFYDKMDELTVNANSMYATDEDILKSKYMSAVNSALSKLYQQKREIQNSNLSDAEKYAKVRTIQQRIVDLSREGLAGCEDVNIQGVYATVGDQQFRWYEPGEGSEAEASWKRLTADQIAKQDAVTEGLGITPAEYWGRKEEYDYAYESPGKYALAQAVGGYDSYMGYRDALGNIKSDKDEDGNTISGSRKQKVVDYINGLDAAYGEKIILYVSAYPSKESRATYGAEIVDYLSGREDLSYQDVVTILTELGFTVRDDGWVTWD